VSPDPVPVTQLLGMNSIAETIEDNFGELFKYFADKGNLKKHVGSKVSWVDSRPFCWPNFIFDARFIGKSVDRDIGDVVSHIRSGSAPPFWLIGPKIGVPDIGEKLREQGLMRVDSWPGMALDLGANELPEEPDGFLDVKIASTKRELADWHAVASRELFPRRKLDLRMLAKVDGGPNIHFFVGFFEGEVVSTAMSFYSSGAAGLYMIATSAAHRGRGFGRAITAAALRQARWDGQRVAILQSTKSGYGVYRRLGFEEYCHFDVFWMPGDEYR